MRRYNTINLDKTIKIEEYEDPKFKYGPYIVDDSNFVPISEAIKQLSNQVLHIQHMILLMVALVLIGQDIGCWS